ncbi:MAG: trypsin-like peptidase domain-containing protein [Elusimicrobiota bacterium]
MKMFRRLAAGFLALSLNTPAMAAPLAYNSDDFAASLDQLLQEKRDAGFSGPAPRARRVHNEEQAADFIEDNLEATVAILVLNENNKQAAARESFQSPFFQEKKGPKGSEPNGADPRAPRGGSSGSGAILSKDGYIVTNHHVVESGSKFEVVFNDGSHRPAKLIGTDPATDLAVLKVEGSDYKTISWTDKRPGQAGKRINARLGNSVIAIGSPMGHLQTVTRGIISRFHVQEGMSPISDYQDVIQVDSAINPGSSGGPLFHEASGQFLGLNEAIFSPDGTFMGIGYTIPAYQVQYISETLIKNGKVVRGSLGIGITPLNQTSRLAVGAPQSLKGVLVTDVPAQSPNVASGLAAGDVIMDINGAPVKDTLELRWKTAQLAPGSTASVNVWRKGEKKTFTVKAVLKPDAPAPKAQ